MGADYDVHRQAGKPHSHTQIFKKKNKIASIHKIRAFQMWKPVFLGLFPRALNLRIFESFSKSQVMTHSNSPFDRTR